MRPYSGAEADRGAAARWGCFTGAANNLARNTAVIDLNRLPESN